MNEKKQYESPVIEIVEIELEDVICASGTGTLKGINFGDMFGSEG